VKAIQVRTVGGPEVLELRDVPDPVPQAGQALVRVHTSGVNFVDVYFREGKYKAPLPFIPGGEGSGHVEALGEGVADLSVGDAVAWLGSVGSYAEKVVVPADRQLASCFLLLVSTAATVPRRLRVRGLGASHFAEVWFVFDHLDQSPWNWTAGDRKLTGEKSSHWVNFAKSGDPNSPGLPVWPAFINAESKVQYLSDPITVGSVANITGLTVYSMVRGKPFAAR
jgi:Alcohol dehydrogenase GroES-like domain/Carboxylesterase family